MKSIAFVFLCLLLCTSLYACQDSPPGRQEGNTSEKRGDSSRSESGLPSEMSGDASSETLQEDAGDSGAEPTLEPTVEPVPEVAPEPAPEVSLEPVPEVAPEPTPEPSVVCQAQKGSDVLTGISGWKELALNKAAISVPMGGCKALGLRFVAPKGMKLRIEIQGLPVKDVVEVQVLNARRMYKVAQDKPLASATSTSGKDYLVMEATIGQSGENAVTIDGRWNPSDVTLQIKLVCIDKCFLETTRFPTAFVHGFAGTDKYFGFLDYYYRVKDDLTKKGYSVVMPRTQPVATSKIRVQPLKKQLLDFLKKTGARRVNLIAHSQGGLDCRHLISVEKWGKYIASLTTVATPHKGMPLPATNLFPLFKEMSESTMKTFNQKYKDDPQVKYFSWKAVSCGLLSFSCQRKNQNERVDALLTASYRTLQALRGDNDGVVPTSSMGWGTVLGTIPADHWDQIGQVADRNNKPFNHLKFYHSEVKRLQKLNF
jgi:triacylglycerol lipase